MVTNNTIMINKIKKFGSNVAVFFLTAFFLPFTALAQTNTACSNNLKTVADIFYFFVCLISKSVIPLLFVLAITVFLFGVVKYMMNGDDETARKEGAQFMTWGIIALFVMISVWGLVGILRNTFGIKNVIPQLQR